MWRDPCECEEDIKREKEGRGETRRVEGDSDIQDALPSVSLEQGRKDQEDGQRPEATPGTVGCPRRDNLGGNDKMGQGGGPQIRSLYLLFNVVP